MRSRDEKIKKVLAQSYHAILTAITSEDGLDSYEGQRIMRKILSLFKTPLPPVKHQKVEGCPHVGRHTFAECGLDIPLNLSGKNFELK
jgi:hypothetical protein